MTETYTPPLDVPVRFLAVSWDADWEFDSPAILLEPVQRYGFSNNFQITEDAIDDILIDEEVRQGFHPQDLHEFEWRRWDIQRLRLLAEESVRTKSYKEFEGATLSVVEQTVIFTRNHLWELDAGKDRITFDTNNRNP